MNKTTAEHAEDAERIKKIEDLFSIQCEPYFNFFLFPVAYMRRTIARLTGAGEASDMELPPNWVNRILRVIFESEKYLLPWMKFPFGLSLICVAKKTRSSI